MSASVAAVVLNWNNATETIACLTSLRAADPDVRVVAVDNGSDADDADRIETSGLADVVVRNGTNLGFTGGNNRGLQRALADGAAFVAVLNNQPQGGFITRTPTANIMVASDRSDDGWGFFFGRSPEPQPVNPRQRGGQQYYRQGQPQPQPYFQRQWQPGW